MVVKKLVHSYHLNNYEISQKKSAFYCKNLHFKHLYFSKHLSQLIYQPHVNLLYNNELKHAKKLSFLKINLLKY